MCFDFALDLAAFEIVIAVQEALLTFCYKPHILGSLPPRPKNKWHPKSRKSNLGGQTRFLFRSSHRRSRSSFCLPHRTALRTSIIVQTLRDMGCLKLTRKIKGLAIWPAENLRPLVNSHQNAIHSRRFGLRSACWRGALPNAKRFSRMSRISLDEDSEGLSGIAETRVF